MEHDALLRETWRQRADAWIRWSRDPALDDDFWSYHLPAFLGLLPAPAGLGIDVGCGEGRLTRELQARGYRMIGLDTAELSVRAAIDHPAAAPTLVADAAGLPLADGIANLAVAFMNLHDMDRLPEAVREMARVIAPGGRVAIALLHPFVSGGLAGGYTTGERYAFDVTRGQQTMRYAGRHHSLARYFEVLDDAGLEVTRLREVTDPRSDPPPLRFLHLLARPRPR